MQIKPDFTKGIPPKTPVDFRHFIFALVNDVIIHPENFERRNKQLNEYCENGKINYSELVYHLNLFFNLLNDYRKTNNHILYRFLKLQARFCFIDEDRFGLLQIALPGTDSFTENSGEDAYCGKTSVSGLSSHHGGIVGAHLIGL